MTELPGVRRPHGGGAGRRCADESFVNGRHDRVVPLANAEFLDERLPNSRLEIIDAGHFVWEEASAEYASIILDSITLKLS